MSNEQVTNERQQPDGLSQEELDALQAEEVPQREAMSVLRVPFLSGAPAPVEAVEPAVPDEPA